MARYVKPKKKRKLKFFTKCCIVLLSSLLLLLFSSIYVGTVNTSLTINIQKMNEQVATLKAENHQLSIDIQTLQNKDRVYTIAKEAGLQQNHENVVSITGDYEEAE